MQNEFGFSYKELREKGIKDIYFRKGSRNTKLNIYNVVDDISKTREIYGNIEDESLLDYAETHKGSEIYKGLEWNNDIAGDLYRKHQLHQLLNDIVFVYEKDIDDRNIDGGITRTFEFQAYSHIDSVKGYMPTIEIMSNSNMREELLQKAIKELHYWQRKYQHLEELSFIFKAIENLNIL